MTVTPEGISLDLVLAGLGSRFVAFALDLVLQSVALIVFLVVVLSAFHGTVTTSSGLVAGGVLSLFVLVDFIGYFVFCEMLFSGRTIGKRAAGLRVVRISGQPVGFWSSLLRNIMRLIDMQLGATYLVGAVLILSTNKNQRLGDLLASTLVVRDRTGAAAAWKGASWTSPAGFTTPAWAQGPSPPAGAGQLYLPPELAHWDVSAVPGVRARPRAGVPRQQGRLHRTGPPQDRLRAHDADLAPRGGAYRSDAPGVVLGGRPPRKVSTLLKTGVARTSSACACI